MKNKTIIIISALVALIISVTSAIGGTKALRREFNNYTPGEFYQDNITGPPSTQATITETAKKKQATNSNLLSSAQSIRQNDLDFIFAKNGFFAIDITQSLPLHKIQTDRQTARRLIKKGLNLSEVETIVILRNPAIAAAKSRLRGSFETYSQVNQLDDILRRYTSFTEALRPGVGPMRGASPARTTFPFPALTALKGKVVDQEVEISALKAAIVVRKQITRARRLFWNYRFNQESYKITSQMLNNLQRLEAVAKTRYEAGKTNFQDVIQIRINKEKTAENLITIREIGRNIISRLQEIMDIGPDAEIGKIQTKIRPSKLPALNTLNSLANKHNQELNIARAKVKKMAAMIAMAETMILPQFATSLSRFDDKAVLEVGSAAKMATFKTTTSAKRGAGLPKSPWFGTNDAYLNRTRQQYRAAIDVLKKTENALTAKVREAWFDYDLAQRESNLYRTRIIGLSLAALDVSTRGYESGKVGFADVIASYTNWLDNSLALERKTSDLGIAEAFLAATIGIDNPISSKPELAEVK